MFNRNEMFFYTIIKIYFKNNIFKIICGSTLRQNLQKIKQKEPKEVYLRNKKGKKPEVEQTILQISTTSEKQKEPDVHQIKKILPANIIKPKLVKTVIRRKRTKSQEKFNEDTDSSTENTDSSSEDFAASVVRMNFHPDLIIKRLS